jgi:hypothetical protein
MGSDDRWDRSGLIGHRPWPRGVAVKRGGATKAFQVKLGRRPAQPATNAG